VLRASPIIGPGRESLPEAKVDGNQGRMSWAAFPPAEGPGLRSRLDDDEAFLGHLAHGVGGTLTGVSRVTDSTVRHVVGPP